jgi:hypothetical protein
MGIKQQALRAAILCEWGLIIIAVILSFTLESSLPPQLREWLAHESGQGLSKSYLINAGVGVIIIGSAIISSIGLFFFRNWAKWVYLVSTVSGYVLLPFTGPTVEHAVTDTADELSIIVCGMILALAFFTDVVQGKKVSNHEPDRTGELQHSSPFDQP